MTRDAHIRLGRAIALLLLIGAVRPGAIRAQEAGSYTLGPNDVLAISVYGQSQLSGKYAIEADGTFSFPLLGPVKAGGLTLRSIETILRDRLSHGYLQNPQVTVSIDQYRSQQVFVVGEVRQPGALPFAGRMTLLEALARAGSTTDRAGQEAIIVHGGEAAAGGGAGAAESGSPADRPDAVHVDLQLLQRGALDQNLALSPDDTVFVPRAATVFVSGAVKTPGEYVLRKGMTVRQAIVLAGGANERGSLGRVQIVREHDGTETKTDAALGDAVQAGDTIVVREKLF